MRIEATRDHDSTPMCNKSAYLDLCRPISQSPWRLAADHRYLERVLLVMRQCSARRLILICSLVLDTATSNSDTDYLDDCEPMADFRGLTRLVQFQRKATTNLDGHGHAF